MTEDKGNKSAFILGNPSLLGSIYSTAQMDNFYNALGKAHVKPSGIMNYIQHLFVAERCPSQSRVLDVCCGRALLLPLLRKYASHIKHYVGVDISHANIREARALVARPNGDDPFPCILIQCDITQLSMVVKQTFDIVAYTSALEHLDQQSGVLSLRQVSAVMSEAGQLFLSTPRTNGAFPRKTQYSVHIYEWDRQELERCLHDAGFEIVDCFGLLPPSDDLLTSAIASQFGIHGVSWYQEMRKTVPYAFLAPVVASCFPSVATELMYVCKRRL